MAADGVGEAAAIAAAIQADAHCLGLDAHAWLDPARAFDALVTDSVLRDTTSQLFIEGHYALAVEEAYKYLNNVVKSRSGLRVDGADLMRTALSPKKPVLKLNELRTPSQRDQQHGYMDILAGCMTGIRNPRAHEHRYLDESRVALELIVLANHLLCLVTGAKRARSRRISP